MNDVYVYTYMYIYIYIYVCSLYYMAYTSKHFGDFKTTFWLSDMRDKSGDSLGIEQPNLGLQWQGADRPRNINQHDLQKKINGNPSIDVSSPQESGDNLV